MRVLKVLTVVVIASVIPAGVAIAAASPAASTDPAARITNTSAVIHGTVNPNGAATTYFFQWGLTTSYGGNGAPHHLAARPQNAAVADPLQGLTPGTVYHYRVVATNSLGTSYGADRTFKTTGTAPPLAQTGALTGSPPVTATSATVTGTVSPNGAVTTWAFQYGPTTAYGAQTPSVNVAAGILPVPVSAPLQNLPPGTIFHYRLVAVHAGIISYGADASWMTFPAKGVRTVVLARTTPRHARHRPFVLTTSGRITPPATIPALYACSGGQATVRFVYRRNDIASRLVPVHPDCTFSTRVTLAVRRGHRHHRASPLVRVNVHFFGNGYLAPANGHPEDVRLG